jgi:hypothetical protein
MFTDIERSVEQIAAITDIAFACDSLKADEAVHVFAEISKRLSVILDSLALDDEFFTSMSGIDDRAFRVIDSIRHAQRSICAAFTAVEARFAEAGWVSRPGHA